MCGSFYKGLLVYSVPFLFSHAQCARFFFLNLWIPKSVFCLSLQMKQREFFFFRFEWVEKRRVFLHCCFSLSLFSIPFLFLSPHTPFTTVFRMEGRSCTFATFDFTFSSFTRTFYSVTYTVFSLFFFFVVAFITRAKTKRSCLLFLRCPDFVVYINTTATTSFSLPSAVFIFFFSYIDNKEREEKKGSLPQNLGTVAAFLLLQNNVFCFQ